LCSILSHWGSNGPRSNHLSSDGSIASLTGSVRALRESRFVFVRRKTEIRVREEPSPGDPLLRRRGDEHRGVPIPAKHQLTAVISARPIWPHSTNARSNLTSPRPRQSSRQDQPQHRPLDARTGRGVTSVVMPPKKVGCARKWIKRVRSHQRLRPCSGCRQSGPAN
jgi:hypothetical protein